MEVLRRRSFVVVQRKYIDTRMYNHKGERTSGGLVLISSHNASKVIISTAKALAR